MKSRLSPFWWRCHCLKFATVTVVASATGSPSLWYRWKLWLVFEVVELDAPRFGLCPACPAFIIQPRKGAENRKWRKMAVFPAIIGNFVYEGRLHWFLSFVRYHAITNVLLASMLRPPALQLKCMSSILPLYLFYPRKLILYKLTTDSHVNSHYSFPVVFY